MTMEHVLALLGGLALFLYGMHMMSVGLEEAAGDKMKMILEKLTSNRFLGVLVGALITAVIQSSSATTVMVVGFVNSGLMTLRQAIWIIMGANIGTTITGQLVALNVGEMAPIMAIIGVVLVTFISNKKLNSIGEIIAGLGVLFIGMGMMGDAMYPLRESDVFINLMTSISNPFIAVLVGAGFTALIQSSSASVGILQTLANSGLIGLSSSIYIIFGQNIGTCITAALASIGANRGAKRTTIIHLSFNIIGTIIFMAAIQFVPLVGLMESITSNPAAQIANTHTTFNIVTTLILLPFGNYLALLAEKILPIHEEEINDNPNALALKFVNTNNIGNSTIAIASLKQEATLMFELAQKNINDSLFMLFNHDTELTNKVVKREKRVNSINYQITQYMSQVGTLIMNGHEREICTSLYKCFSDIERISDHAVNILEHGNGKLKKSKYILSEIDELKGILNDSFAILLQNEINEESLALLKAYENKVDELTDQYRQRQIERLSLGQVDAEDCVRYSQIMTDIERISDHLMNMIEECIKNNFTLINE